MIDPVELAALRQEVFDTELMRKIEALVEFVQARSAFLAGEHGDGNDAFETLWSRFAEVLYERHLRWEIDGVRDGKNALIDLLTGEFAVVDMLDPEEALRVKPSPGVRKAFVLTNGTLSTLRPPSAVPTVPD